MHTLGDIAAFVTSKNAGPFLLTLDIVFPDAETYRRFKALRVLNRSVIAGLYGLMEEDVLKIIEFDPAFAVKITLRRPWASGAVGETDVYGAQQHVPLMELAVPWEDGGCGEMRTEAATAWRPRGVRRAVGGSGGGAAPALPPRTNE